MSTLQLRWTQMRASASALLLLIAGASLIPCASSTAQQATNAQGGGGITLTVRDSTGRGIAGAQLMLGGVLQQPTSDANGVFHLVGLIAGETTLRVRRLGFRPGSLDVTVTPGQTLELAMTLAPVAQPMPTIQVKGSMTSLHGRLADFYRRRDTGGGSGHFYTREQIEKANLRQLSDLFRMIPGMRVADSPGRSQVRMRSAPSWCWPLVWLDGAPLAAAEFDLDNIQPNSLDAIEVYAGPASVPPEFMGPRGLGSCGVVALWSRIGEPRAKKPKNQLTPAQLAELVAALKVYTADQVDRPARPDSANMGAPLYPDSLYYAGVGGSVVAEFVVDSTGHVAMETFGVVSSTHHLFSDAVQRSVADALFIPAMREGKLVRQVVQQPFTFVAPDLADRRRRE